MRHLSIALGTRPEIIKLAPIIRRLRDKKIPLTLIHTNQHYDHILDGVFFEELDLPPPTHHLHAAAGSHGEMFGKMFPAFEKVWTEDRPEAVIVQGDTNSSFAAALIATRLRIPVAHVEAGLRSDDWDMPEEANRVMTDHLANRLYAPTEEHAARLLGEGIAPEKILVTGNTIADAVTEHRVIAKKAALPAALSSYAGTRFALLTLHRPALVDDPVKLRSMLTATDELLVSESMRGVLLTHPRTRKQLGDTPLPLKALAIEEPIGYLPMLKLFQDAAIIITDSGGLQEEAAILQIPCVTVRENTERPETLKAGGNRIVGFDHAALQQAVHDFLHGTINWKPLYSVAHPSDMIVADLLSHFPCASS
ncbi:UDP-N-acetylglucosamine 2-epimerase (non-hydrolyzing) [Candidatus Peregrinibacteria bacterium]|nr:UDP-N-acetylglucosamine 2-epimerase (non-hydrolyzing) [Candidatus Peregrinibacteria bacterium]